MKATVPAPLATALKKKPVSPSTPAAATTFEAAPAPISTKLKVLLVDDHPITRQGMKALVNQQANLEVVGERTMPPMRSSSWANCSPTSRSWISR